MGDLFQALSLFSNISLFKAKAENAKGRFTLCYFPLVGVISAIVIRLWYLIVNSFNINNIVACLVATVIFTAIMGNKTFETIIKIFNHIKITAFVPIALYAIVVAGSFFTMGTKGAYIVPGVVILSRITALFMIIDNDRLVEGFYKELTEKSAKMPVAIITVVWLMATLTFFEMMSFIKFIMMFITTVMIYFGVYRASKKTHRLTDESVNFYIVFLEFVIYIEFIIVWFLNK